MYLSYEQYKEHYPDTTITENQFTALENRAENDINGLTFNRITAIENLTRFQQKLVRQAVAMQITFISDNSELIDSPLSSYSISGVSMSFDKSKIMACDGVTTTRQIYNYLVQTGLCYRGI